MSKAHVICCNDSVEFVVIGDEEKAIIKLEELADEHFSKNKMNMRSFVQGEPFITHAEYRRECYWHIHTVTCDDKETFSRGIHKALGYVEDKEDKYGIGNMCSQWTGKEIADDIAEICEIKGVDDAK